MNRYKQLHEYNLVLLFKNCWSLQYFFLSKIVTEYEISDGIMTVEDPNSHAMVFLRRLTDLDGDKVNDELAAKHIDTAYLNGKVLVAT